MILLPGPGWICRKDLGLGNGSLSWPLAMRNKITSMSESCLMLFPSSVTSGTRSFVSAHSILGLLSGEFQCLEGDQTVEKAYSVGSPHLLPETETDFQPEHQQYMSFKMPLQGVSLGGDWVLRPPERRWYSQHLRNKGKGPCAPCTSSMSVWE